MYPAARRHSIGGESSRSNRHQTDSRNQNDDIRQSPSHCRARPLYCRYSILSRGTVARACRREDSTSPIIETMANQSASDHWDILASELGTSPDPSSTDTSKEPTQPAPVEAPVAEAAEVPATAKEPDTQPADQGSAWPAVETSEGSAWGSAPEPPPRPESRPAEAVSPREPRPRRTPSPAQRAPEQWADVFSELGLEPPPEPVPPPVKAPAPVATRSPVETRSPVAAVSPVETPLTEAEAEAEAEADRESEPPFPRLETPSELMSEIAAERSVAAEASEYRSEERQGGRRRRRRRGGRSGEPADRESERGPRGPRPPAPRDVEEPAADIEAADEPEAPEVDERPATGGEESGPTRGRRRRRRRGPGRDRATRDARTPAEAEGRGEEPADEGFGGQTLGRSPSGRGRSRRSSRLATGHLTKTPWPCPTTWPPTRPRPRLTTRTAAGPSATTTPRPCIRAIPSWEEVVGIVVSANMASRANNPDRGKSGGHSRSGRRGATRRQALVEEGLRIWTRATSALAV